MQSSFLPQSIKANNVEEKVFIHPNKICNEHYFSKLKGKAGEQKLQDTVSVEFIL